jgi:hypothetical protein
VEEFDGSIKLDYDEFEEKKRRRRRRRKGKKSKPTAVMMCGIWLAGRWLTLLVGISLVVGS